MEAFLKTGKISNPGEGPAQKSVKRDRPLPWVEKYRPKKVDEVSHQEEVVAVLKEALNRSDLPNLLFYGPPGTGKTTTILAASRDLFGDIWRSRILELNASDERGIAVVRDKIKNFSQQTVSNSNSTKVPPFKIVILDEADSMTKDAQSALRRTMEKQPQTRFCLICNYISRIIEPITSRCAKFRFKPLSDSAIKDRIRIICDSENLTLKDDDAFSLLINSSEGDMRKAITTLQSCSRLNTDITERDIFEVSGTVPNQWVDRLLNKVGRSGSFDKVNDFVKDLSAEGFSITRIISQVHDTVVGSDKMTDHQKSAICEKLAVSEARLLDGASEYLQMLDIISFIMNQLSKS